LGFGADFGVGGGVGGDDQEFGEAFLAVFFDVDTPVGFAGFDFDGDGPVTLLGNEVGVAVDGDFKVDLPALDSEVADGAVFPVFLFESSAAAVVWGGVAEVLECGVAGVGEFGEDGFAAAQGDVDGVRGGL